MLTQETSIRLSSPFPGEIVLDEIDAFSQHPPVQDWLRLEHLDGVLDCEEQFIGHCLK
jgi:hypothetical protein